MTLRRAVAGIGKESPALWKCRAQPAQSTHETADDLDRSPGFDPAEPEPGPNHRFAQARGW